MPGLRRRSPTSLLPDVSRRLAEEFPGIPLPDVARVVQDAAATVIGADGEWAGTPQGVTPVVEVIEHVAREDLAAMTAPGAETDLPE
jgi:hypothetical protein